MIFFYLSLLVVLVYWLLLLLPKGNLLQEIGQLPIYLWKVRGVPLKGLTVNKYKFGSHSRQYFLLYQSEISKAADKPIIIYYHGGGWTFGSPEQFAANAKFFTDLGFDVIMPSFRRLPFYRSQAIAEDRLLALSKINALCKEKNWDSRKFILGGLSAGANVVALLCYDLQGLQKINFDRNRFVGLMLCGAPLDLSGMVQTPLLYCYAGKTNSESYLKVSPVSYLRSADAIPVLIIHGTKDGMVSYKNVARFVQRCKELKMNNLTVNIINKGTHLDAGRWVFENNETAKTIQQWLNSLLKK